MDQARVEKYASWLVQNKDKKGTPEFETVANAYKTLRSQSTQSPLSKGPADATQIEKNPEWAKRGKLLYKESNGKDFTGSDQDAATWLKDYIYDFNNRLIGSNTDTGRGTVDIAATIGSFSPDAKKAFVDAQNDYENMGYSWKGAGEVTKRILTDPTTYLGLGVGKLLSKGAQVAATEGVKELAKRGASQGLKEGAKIGAVEGAIYTGASDAARQAGMINAGGQESFDPLQTAQSAGIGALGGSVIGGAVGSIGGGIAGRNPTVKAAKELTSDPEMALRQAEITQALADRQAAASKFDGDVRIGTKQSNAIMNKDTARFSKDLENLNLPPEELKRYQTALKQWDGFDQNDIASLRGTPQGDAVANHIEKRQQQSAITRPVPNDGALQRYGRFAIDKISPAPLITDPIKQLLFPARISAEARIAKLITPKNLAVAKEISRLGGQSEASVSIQAIKDTAEQAKQLVEAHKAIMKATSSKLDLEAIARNEVPGGGAFKYAYYKTGLRPQELNAGIEQLTSDGTIPQEVAKLFKDDPLKLKQGNVLNKILDRLNSMAESGLLPRDPKWSPNTGDQVMTQGIANYSPAMAQANANQARVTDVQRLISAANVDPSEVQTLKTAVAEIGKTNNREEARAVFENMLQNIKSPEGMRLAQQEIPALIEQIRHKTPKDAQAARKRQ